MTVLHTPTHMHTERGEKRREEGEASERTTARTGSAMHNSAQAAKASSTAQPLTALMVEEKGRGETEEEEWSEESPKQSFSRASIHKN